MAQRGQTRPRSEYNDPRPMPDTAPLGADGMAPPARRGDVREAASLNVLAGIWLIISPFVLNYSGADATWNPIVFGAIVGVFALARVSGVDRRAWLSWLNGAIGVWLFISAFWLAESTRASWNVAIMGVVVFVLACTSLAVRSPVGGRPR
jgi:peptidoglycan/LPS O-acetylase OafA/YrhL